MIRINVLSPTGTEQQPMNDIELAPSAAVSELRALVAARYLPSGGNDNNNGRRTMTVLQLHHMGHIMANDRALSDYAMIDGATVQAVVAVFSASVCDDGGHHQQQQQQQQPSLSSSVSARQPARRDVGFRGVVNSKPRGVLAGLQQRQQQKQQQQRSTAAATANTSSNASSLAGLLNGLTNRNKTDTKTSNAVAPGEVTVSFAAPEPAPGTVALGGDFFLEHLARESKKADYMPIGTGYLVMGNAQSLAELRLHFAEGWAAYRAAQAGVTFPAAAAAPSSNGVHSSNSNRVISLAGSEGERLYAALLAQPKTRQFLVSAGVSNDDEMAVINTEARNLAKNTLLRLMRLSKEPAARTPDAEWAEQLNEIIAFTAGFGLSQADRWFPNGGRDAAVTFATDALTEQLSSSSPSGGNGQKQNALAAMLPMLAPQVASRLEREYQSKYSRGEADLENLSQFPTAAGAAFVDVD